AGAQGAHQLFSWRAPALMVEAESGQGGPIAHMHVLLRGDVTQRLRIASGLVLFAFAATHFLNHAVGFVDLRTMHDVQAWRQMVTRSLPGTFILLMALVTHVTLAL